METRHGSRVHSAPSMCFVKIVFSFFVSATLQDLLFF
jgi:hypothetical protein